MLSNLKKRIAEFAGEENLEFLSHSKNYLSGTLIQNILMAASLPLFTYLLTPAEYGTVSIFLTVISMLVIVFGLNINSGIIRYYLEKKDDFNQALGTNIIFYHLFALVPLTIILIFSKQLAQLSQLSEELFIFASLTAMMTISVEIYMAYLNASQQSKKYAFFLVLKTALMLIISISIMLYLKKDRYLGRVFGELIMMSILSGYALFALVKISKLNFKKTYIRYSLRFSLPLIPHAMSRFILGYFDRIIIQQLTNSTSTGLYSFAYDVGVSMNLIVLSTVRAWRPIFFEEYREDNFPKISRMAQEYANNIYLIAFAIILFAKDFIYILADAKFYQSIIIIPPIVMGYVFVFLYTLYFQYAAFEKRTELISISTFIAGFANIGLNYWFIPIYGYIAAAYTTFFSFGLLFALHYINSKFIIKAKTIPLIKVLPNFGILLIAVGLFMYLDSIISSYIVFLLIRLGLMGLGIIYYLHLKKLTARRVS